MAKISLPESSADGNAARMPLQDEPGPAADLEEAPAVRKVGLHRPDDELVPGTEPEVGCLECRELGEVVLAEALVVRCQGRSEGDEAVDDGGLVTAVVATPVIAAAARAAGRADPHVDGARSRWNVICPDANENPSRA